MMSRSYTSITCTQHAPFIHISMPKPAKCKFQPLVIIAQIKYSFYNTVIQNELRYKQNGARKITNRKYFAQLNSLKHSKDHAFVLLCRNKIFQK